MNHVLAELSSDFGWVIRQNHRSTASPRVPIPEVRTNLALAEFTERLYTVYVEQLKGGHVAGYEPMQLRAFTNQARALALASRNQYLSAWRQLAAALGLEDRLPLTEVAGSAEMIVPAFAHEEVLARVLKQHTDIQTAQNALQKARGRWCSR